MNGQRAWGSVAAGVVFLVGVLTLTGRCWSQEAPLVERLFRSAIVDVRPVFAAGEMGNPNEIVGFRVESVLYDMQESIEHGVIPRPRESGLEPVGRAVAELRCLGDARIDKSKPMQILRATAEVRGRTLAFDVTGTAIIHWVHDQQGRYTGVRWTDFSGVMSNIQGRSETARGHYVGTRLLIGDPELRAQSGLVIVRFRAA